METHNNYLDLNHSNIRSINWAVPNKLACPGPWFPFWHMSSCSQSGTKKDIGWAIYLFVDLLATPPNLATSCKLPFFSFVLFYKKKGEKKTYTHKSKGRSLYQTDHSCLVSFVFLFCTTTTAAAAVHSCCFLKVC